MPALSPCASSTRSGLSCMPPSTEQAGPCAQEGANARLYVNFSALKPAHVHKKGSVGTCAGDLAEMAPLGPGRGWWYVAATRPLRSRSPGLVHVVAVLAQALCDTRAL
jgi:hypothetical protein